MTDSPLSLDLSLTPVSHDSMTDPGGYIPTSSELIKATEVARLLGKPLLLTGEPGSGKSQFASWVADQLKPGAKPLEFVVKSNTDAYDIFYRYDSLARFHDAQTGVQHNTLHYIDYGAMGTAILSTLPRQELIDQKLIDESARFNYFDDQQHTSVVLIDEIDKAPRDVPNDILVEIEARRFRVRQLGDVEVQARDPQPLVIITSNSERDLPGPFLRRCVYFDVPFPSNKSTLQTIIASRLGAAKEHPAFSLEAINFFNTLRQDETGLSRKPGLAELLDWLQVLVQSPDAKAALSDRDEATLIAQICSTMIKDASDQEKVKTAWQHFRRGGV